MRAFITALLAVCALTSTAAELRLRGEVTDHVTRQPLGEVLVRVYRDGVKERSFTTGPGGRYSVSLQRGGEYIIRFSLPGHVTKCYAVDTKGPAWENDKREVSVDVEMTLFEKVPDLDLSFFDMPMGLARFCPMTGFLKWDKAYEERIAPEVSRLMAEVRLRREASQGVTAGVGD
ncbi:MAG: carboxypeptidase regulatory-like domain-containing protein [Flavobacteriales bacterium]|nr:carboxypeptidase regulatory-like domain-containing protein [Flavobacteriales bacterium]